MYTPKPGDLVVEQDPRDGYQDLMLILMVTKTGEHLHDKPIFIVKVLHLKEQVVQDTYMTEVMFTCSWRLVSQCDRNGLTHEKP